MNGLPEGHRRAAGRRKFGRIYQRLCFQLAARRSPLASRGSRARHPNIPSRNRLPRSEVESSAVRMKEQDA
jgi:hypothetical protein